MWIGKAATREEKTMMISVTPHNLYLMSVVVDDVNPFVEFKGQLSFLHNQVSIDEVFHFEGLLLCILKDNTRVVVWNPYLGQTRWIKLRYPHGYRFWVKLKFALGYEDKESCPRVKFLRFLNLPEKEEFFEIYDFDSDLWTTLDVTPNWYIPFSDRGVSVKGNTYWPAKKKSSSRLPRHIICFDFTRERFGPLLPLPLGARARGYTYVILSCVKEEKLAALLQYHNSYEYQFEIWITTKIEANMVSWSKFLRMVDMRNKICFPVTFFIDMEKKVFAGFDHRDYPKTFILTTIREAKYLRKLDLAVPERNYCRTPLCYYVPSSVQIKKPARVPA